MAGGIGVSLARPILVGVNWPRKYITLSRRQLSSTEKFYGYEAAFRAVF